MLITFTIQYWQLALAFPFLFFFGIIFYAGALNAWKPELALWVKFFVGIPILIFGAGDVLFRYTFGGLLLRDWSHGWTFSQCLCYYINIKDGSFNYKVACFFALLLNPFNEGHIS